MSTAGVKDNSAELAKGWIKKGELDRRTGKDHQPG